MVYYKFLFTKIDIDSYLSFKHFLTHLSIMKVPATIEITIAETGGDFFLAKEIYHRLVNDSGLKQHTIETKIINVSTAGLIIALGADYENRTISQYGKLKYKIFQREGEKYTQTIYNNMFLIDSELTQFQQILDLIHDHTKMNYKEIEKYDNKEIKVTEYIIKKIVKKIEVKHNYLTLQAIAHKILLEGKIIYNFTDELLIDKINEILNNYQVGMISSKKGVNLIMNEIINY